MEFRLLGPLEVCEQGRRVQLGGPKQRAVLAFLLVRENRLVPAAQLIHDLWGDEPPAGARASLQSYVSHLRSALNGTARIEGTSAGYTFEVDPETVDAHRFEQLIKSGREALEHDPASALRCLDDALSLWRGAPFADLVDYAVQDPLRGEVARLEELRAGALEDRVAAELALGAHDGVIGEIGRLIEQYPLRERLWSQSMVALYRAGRQAEALDTYQRLRNRLADELGIDPSPEVQECHARVLAQDPGLLAPALASDGNGHGRDTLEVIYSIPDDAVGEPERTPPPPVRNPYKGLLPFGEDDVDDFFGREDCADHLVERVGASRFVAVVGPSGSGKSSVVRAGLIPRLRGGALPGSETWTIVTIHPGAHPLEELEAALLRVAVNPPASLMEQLERDELGLLRASKRVLPSGDSELLLVIDQFEELYTLTRDPVARTHTIALLRAAVLDPRSQLRIVITVRADLYDRPLRDRAIADLVASEVVSLAPLSPEAIERAATRPAGDQGIELEPSLVARIVGDVVDQPGSLPLLQFALTELFELRTGTRMTLASYEQLGGVSGALVRRAESVVAGLEPARKELTRQVLLRLVTLGEGTADARRRVPVEEVAQLAADGDDEVTDLLDQLVAHRLLSYDRDPVSGRATVEVAHEALLWSWQRLKTWIDDARDELRTHRVLQAAVAEWRNASRDPSYLLRGARLDRMERWSSDTQLVLTPTEQEFVTASVAQRDAELADEAEQLARERDLERRAVRRLRAFVVVLTLASLVAASLSFVAYRQRRVAVAETARAEQQVRVATARELAAASAANLDLDPERSILLALEAVDVTLATDGTVVPDAEEALHRALKRSRVVYSVEATGRALAVTSDGTRFLTSTDDGKITIRDLENGQVVDEFQAHDAVIADAAFSPDDRLLATSGEDHLAHLWDLASGEQLHSFQLPVTTLEGGDEFVPSITGLAFSPDGTVLATTSDDTTVRVWDVTSGQQLALLEGHTGTTWTPSFAPDGSRLVTAGDYPDMTARIWDLATGSTEHVLAGHAWQLAGAAFSPDGTTVATASIDGTARMWDADTGKVRVHLTGHAGPVEAVGWSRDGALLATGAADATVRVWDAATGAELLVLSGHTSGVNRVAFTPDGTRVLTRSYDNSVRLWDISAGGGRDWLTISGGYLRYVEVEFSPDGSMFATPTEPDGVSVRDSATGGEVIHLTGHGFPTIPVSWSPDGRLVAGGPIPIEKNKNWRIPVWEVATGEMAFELVGHEEETRDINWSPDGRHILTGGFDGTVRRWDAQTGRLLETLAADPFVGSVVYSHDGRYIAVGGSDGQRDQVTILEANSRKPLRTLDTRSVAVFGPDGTLYTAAADSSVQAWDVSTGEQIRSFQGHHSPIERIAVSDDGRMVAATSGDGTARVWDAVTAQRLFTLHGHSKLAYGVDFSPDGRLLATASADGTVALHLLPIEELRDLARSRLTRGLTDEECREYLGDRCGS